MYAIVDIETTGGHASANGITEIAIVLHDGVKVIDSYQTLVNPGIPIPVYISALTGISNEMVSSAPSFRQIAAEVYHLLHDKIFIAHNVNFDYSFLKYHLNLAGYNLQCKKLCTVRLGRKIFPGLISYSLGKFCSQMQITIESRHRAGGDALATAQLFELMLKEDCDGHISSSLKAGSKEQQLPPNLNKEDFLQLPPTPGVYYFLDQKGKVIYVGKAKNIKKRVSSHFTGNNSGRQRQDFMKNICSIKYKECGTELIALIHEAAEIKKLWPENNRALKRFDQAYGIYTYEDQKGYCRLVIDKRKKHSVPVYAFNSLLEGHNLLNTLVKEYSLCPKLSCIQKNNDECVGVANSECHGACKGHEHPGSYNLRVQKALNQLKAGLPSYLIFDEGRLPNEQSVILMEHGHLTALGFVPSDFSFSDMEVLKSCLEPYPSNDYIRNTVHSYASKNPERVVSLS